jgi:dihydrofolate reductase
MASTVLYMSMSLDGFVAGPNETIDNGLGDGGERLHDWVIGPASDQLKGADREVVDEFMSTGAVLAGRGTFEPAQGWNGDHHDGVPIFILSRHQPAPEFAPWPGVTYLSLRPRRRRP